MLRYEDMPWTHRSFWIGPIIIGSILAVLLLVFSRGRLYALYQERFPESAARVAVSCVRSGSLFPLS